jgi:hypothetical protein
VTCSAAELRLLNNALNEALEALASDPGELETRMGASVEQVKALLDEVNRLVRQLE